VHPETADDRLNMLADFGETITATPAVGGPSFQFVAIFNEGPRRVSELDLSEIAPVEIEATEPYLLARAEDVTRLDQYARVVVPSQPGLSGFWRVHLPERDEADGLLRVIRLLEGV
jgi:hypothetical protein